MDTETIIKNWPPFYCLLCFYLCLQGPVFLPSGFVETTQFCFLGTRLELSVDKRTFTLAPRLSRRLRIIRVLRHCSILASVHFAFSKIHLKHPNKAPPSSVRVLACRSA